MVAHMRLEEMDRELEKPIAGLEGDQDNLNMHGAFSRSKGIQEKGEPSGSFRDAQQEMKKDSRSSHVLPKMSFPRFVGGDPVFWIDQCIDYFTIYGVPEAIWVSSAAMHLEEGVTQWWKCYKL